MSKVNIETLKKHLPYIVFFICVLGYCLTATIMVDDIWFRNTMLDTNIFSFVSSRYSNWTSRVIIEFFLGLLASSNINIWKIINMFVLLLIPYSISKMFNKEKNYKFEWLIILFIFLYPIADMKEAGWMATTLNYFWPLSFGLFSLSTLMDLVKGKKVSKTKYILSTILLIYATNAEQMCCLIFGFFALALIYFKFIKKGKIPVYVYIGLILSILSLISIYLCPGNDVRMEKEIETWYPEFNSFGLLSKISMLFLATASILLKNWIIISSLSVLFCFAICKTNTSKLTKIISILNAIFINIIIKVRDYKMFNTFFNNINYKGVLIDKNNLFDIDRLLPFIFSIYLVFIFGYLIYKLFGKKNPLPLIIYVAGFLSRFIICLSPTIFISGSRTMIYYYFSMIIEMFLSYKSVDKLMNKKEILALWLILIIYVITNVKIEVF